MAICINCAAVLQRISNDREWSGRSDRRVHSRKQLPQVPKLCFILKAQVYRFTGSPGPMDHGMKGLAGLVVVQARVRADSQGSWTCSK
jgi:hypothetical protein